MIDLSKINYFGSKAYGYIYKFTNKHNGKCYIGQHKGNKFDVNYTGSGVIWSNVCKKYNYTSAVNTDDIKVEVLQWCVNQQDLNRWEKFYILTERTYNRNVGYNVKFGGDNHIVLPYTRKKISDANRGKKRSEETRKKLGDANRGKKLSEETRKKMSEAQKGKYTGENSYWFGKHLSEEIRKKISESKKGKYAGENNPSFGRFKYGIIYCISQEGNINAFNSWKSIYDFLGIDYESTDIKSKVDVRCRICKVLKNKGKSAYGYFWKRIVD